MVHLKIHFSVRAEYKRLGQRKALTIQCGHLCTHKKLSYTQLNITSFWPHKDDYTLTYQWHQDGYFYDYKHLILQILMQGSTTQVILNWPTVWVVIWLHLSQMMQFYWHAIQGLVGLVVSFTLRNKIAFQNHHPLCSSVGNLHMIRWDHHNC